MRAVKLVGPGKIEIQDVPVPEISDDEILVEVSGAGLCHSDLHILHQEDSWPFFGTTMGHETAGRVAARGSGVLSLAVGDPVLVSAVWSCGACRACKSGRGNACSVNGSRTVFPLTPGIAVDGGMAEFIKVKAQHVNRIAGLDPVASAPLADAGTTPMHTIRETRHLLNDGATAVVIGVGGLGHLALQLLAATTTARLVVVDVNERRLEFATSHGASVVLNAGDDVVSRVLSLTDGCGAEVVFDFVGAQSTVDVAARVVAPAGAIRIVGLAGGSLPVHASLEGELLPWGVSVERPYGGTQDDQVEVIELAQDGRVVVETVTYPLDEAQRAFDDLAAGKVNGRAVLVP
jgi:propanol-preferring alcohol dehydrogenase